MTAVKKVRGRDIGSAARLNRSAANPHYDLPPRSIQQSTNQGVHHEREEIDSSNAAPCKRTIYDGTYRLHKVLWEKKEVHALRQNKDHCENPDHDNISNSVER